MSIKFNPAIFSFLKVLVDKLLPWLPLIFIWWVFIRPVSGPGLIVGSDWIFPYTHQQLQTFADEGWTLWNNREIPTGTQTPHHNLYIFQLFAGLFAATGMSGIAFQRIITSFILISVYFSAYVLFKKLTNHTWASVIGACIYLFSPLVFNYYNMGWWWVLLYMAIAPLFILAAWKYFSTGNLGAAIAAGVLTAIAFLQAQAIFWMPIVATVTAIVAIIRVSPSRVIFRWIILLICMGIITFWVHAAWAIPIILHPEKYLSEHTSQFDVSRFEALANVSNQLRGWGGLFNEHFELSFSKHWWFASYIYLLLAIILLLLPNPSVFSQALLLGLFFIFIPPLLYIVRHIVAWFPYSSIIRDLSRFMVFSDLGFATITCLFFTRVKKWYLQFIVVTLILISLHPFIQGELTKPEKIRYGNSQFGKDQRVRVLDVPQHEIEGVLQSDHGQRSLLFPTGACLSAHHDKRFDQPFSEICDHDAMFSPYASGIYLSGKSNSTITNFAKPYIDAAISDKSTFQHMSQIYGIETIFVRHGLYSNYTKELNFKWEIPSCKYTNFQATDWSISKKCKIHQPYPLIFTSTDPIVATPEQFNQLIKDKNWDPNHRLTAVRCHDLVNNSAQHPCQITLSDFSNSSPPEIKVQRLDKTRYHIEVAPVASSYLLVLNQTFHPGWVITDASTGQPLDYQKLLVNELVTGWLIPDSESQTPRSFIIDFLPQRLFQKLIYFSLAGLFLPILVSIILLRRKNS